MQFPVFWCNTSSSILGILSLRNTKDENCHLHLILQQWIQSSFHIWAAYSIIFTASSADHHHLGLVFFIVFSENFSGKQVHIPGKQIFLGTLWLSTERLSILDSFETVKTLGGENTVVLLAGAWNNISFAIIGPALATEQEKYTMIKAI